MPKGISRTELLQDQIDRAVETLEAAYLPETAREELAQAIGEALDLLRGEAVDDDDDEDED